MSPTVGKNHDQEEFTSPTSGKKSVLTKVKEKAKKLRYSLSGKKKHFHESSISSDGSSHGNSTPSWGVTLEDDKLDDIDNRDDPNEQFEDPEYLGAPSNTIFKMHNFSLLALSVAFIAPEYLMLPETLHDNCLFRNL